MEATPPPPTTPPPVTPPSPPSPAPAAPVPPHRKNWWQRNWKWFVPTGCLTFVAAGVALIFCIVLLIFGAMKSSDAYKTAFARARKDPRVIEAIGQPIHSGWYVSGNTKVNGDSGESDLTIPIHGRKGKAKIYAVATKSEGEWQYSKLTVKIEKTGEKIDLLQESTE
jgi:hypothetical protein